jgi:hypothetical protein
MSKIHQKSSYEVMCDNLYDDIIKRNINYFDNRPNEQEKKIFYDRLLKDYRYFKKIARRWNQYLNTYKYKPIYNHSNIDYYESDSGYEKFILFDKEYSIIENYVVASDRMFWKLYKEYELKLKDENRVNKRRQEINFKDYYFKNDDEWKTIIYLILNCNESKELLKDVERLELYRLRNFGDRGFKSVELKINDLDNNISMIGDNVYVVEFTLDEFDKLNDIYFEKINGKMEIQNGLRTNKKGNKLLNAIDKNYIIKNNEIDKRITIDAHTKQKYINGEIYMTQKIILDLTFKLDYVIVMDKENYIMSMEDNTNKMRRKTPSIEVLRGKSRYVRYDCKKILSSYKKLVDWKIREENYRKC